mgnify:CR=1 FL=1
MIVYVVKEIILCTMDGTVENNIIGIFNKKEKALEAIDERSEELLKEFEDLIPESDVNKGIENYSFEYDILMQKYNDFTFLPLYNISQ